MNYKIAIDAAGGGSELGNVGNGITEKEYTLLISEYINNRLNELGLESILIRSGDQNLTEQQRVDRIKNNYGSGNDVIVISNELNKGNEAGAEIRYALRNNATLARTVANELEKEGATVNKYYQLRLPSDTSKDYDYIIRETPNNQTIIVNYGSVDSPKDAELIKNNWQNYAESIVRAIASYTNTPYETAEGNVYIVKKGDSLWQIAKNLKTSVEEIKKLNNLTNNLLQVGQILKIPTTSTIPPETTESTTSTYTVQKGDSLWTIAQKFNTTVDNLKNINNLKSDTLQIGQVLKISGTNKPTTNTYTVQKGDSLWTIAQKFGTTVNGIKNVNNLKSDTLQIGQQLTIPSQITYKTYAVQKGDSLWTIAKTNNTSVEEIKKINNLVTDTLQIGQFLKIPK